MATESSTKTKTAVTKNKTTSKKTATKHDLLYIMSPQCGWCKKADQEFDVHHITKKHLEYLMGGSVGGGIVA